MNNPLVSILVPAYNAAPYLPSLCRSIQTQTHQNFEVLIADDGSTDNTADVLKPFRADPRFRILQWSKNRGVNSATLALFGLLRGEYWCHPGADDILLPQFVEKRLHLIAANPNAAMVHGAAEYIDGAGTPTTAGPLLTDFPVEMSGKRALSALLQHNFINTPSIMVRSSITKLVFPFFATDWKYAQDWYLWLLHFAMGFDLLWDPEPMHQYRIHSQSLTKAPEKAAVRQAEIRLVPLCALAIAARFSQIAALQWTKWGDDLYALWLRRAISLRKSRLLQNEWIQLGAQSFYGSTCRETGLNTELFRHGLKILQASRKEKQALNRQQFRVSGLAQIDDPIFK